MAHKTANQTTEHTPTTDPGPHAPMLADLPDDPESLPEIVSGLVLHPWLAGQRDVSMTAEHERDCQSRTMTVLLDRLLARDNRPLMSRRAASDRFFGACRDYALVTCSILRDQGYAARTRCGFADYFTPDFHEDHWVTELWTNRGWILIDAELDALTIADMGASFPAADVPRDHFLTAPDAWRAIRSGELNPEKTGVSFIGTFGLWFAAASVCRDLASLYGVELLPWDYWGEPEQFMLESSVLDEHLELLDALATDIAMAAKESVLPPRADLWPSWLTWPNEVMSYGGEEPVAVALAP